MWTGPPGRSSDPTHQPPEAPRGGAGEQTATLALRHAPHRLPGLPGVGAKGEAEGTAVRGALGVGAQHSRVRKCVADLGAYIPAGELRLGATEQRPGSRGCRRAPGPLRWAPRGSALRVWRRHQPRPIRRGRGPPGCGGGDGRPQLHRHPGRLLRCGAVGRGGSQPAPRTAPPTAATPHDREPESRGPVRAPAPAAASPGARSLSRPRPRPRPAAACVGRGCSRL